MERELALQLIGSLASLSIAMLYFGRFFPHRWKTFDSSHIESGMQYYRQKRTDNKGQVHQMTLRVPYGSNPLSKFLRITIFKDISSPSKLTSIGR